MFFSVPYSNASVGNPLPVGNQPHVTLFIQCLVDSHYPRVGMAMVKVLEKLGVPMACPTEQTCCGQPAFNSGFPKEARAVARHAVGNRPAFGVEGVVPDVIHAGLRPRFQVAEHQGGPRLTHRPPLGLGVLSYCRFFGNCSGTSNSTPWFDNVRLGVSTISTLQAAIDAGLRIERLREYPFANGCRLLDGMREELIEAYFHPYLYLDQALIEKRGLDPAAVESALVDELQKLPGIAFAVSARALRSGALPQGAVIDRVKANFHPDRSGDIYIVFDPHWFVADFDGLHVASAHGSPWTYDTHVPIIIAGPGIEQARIPRRKTAGGRVGRGHAVGLGNERIVDGGHAVARPA